MKLQRKKRISKTEPIEATHRIPLTFRMNTEWYYIAVHENGYGVHTDVAKAILLAQESVPMESKPKQLLIYRHHEAIAPTGFGEWANGAKPALVGCTNTHQGWISRKQLTCIT